MLLTKSIGSPFVRYCFFFNACLENTFLCFPTHLWKGRTSIFHSPQWLLFSIIRLARFGMDWFFLDSVAGNIPEVSYQSRTFKTTLNFFHSRVQHPDACIKYYIFSNSSLIHCNPDKHQHSKINPKGKGC